MGSRKNLKTTNNKPQRTPRSRAKAAKPKLESLDEIEHKIPCTQSSGVGNTPAILTKKQLLAQKKIDLANEVARAQLVKDAPVMEAEISTVKIEGKKLQQEIIVFSFDSDAMKDTPRRRLTKNVSTNSKVAPKKRTVTRKTIADSTDTSTTPRTKPVTRNDAKMNQTLCNNNVSHNLRNKKNVELGAEGKENLIEAVNPRGGTVPVLADSPSENTEKSPNKIASPVDSRKTSMTSTSSLSWTKDISSSSTTTCVTVVSNDFVRIDKKIPIIQLNNVDNEVNKLKCNDDDSSSSDSDSSSSSSSENRSDIFDVKPNQLNLSVSSDSIKADVIDPKNATIIDDLSKALDKLSSKLKNYDLEIIDWIGYGNKNSEVNLMQEFQDKMLTILKEESDVIKHCRHLKEILSDDPKVSEKAVNNSPSRNCDVLDFTVPNSIYGRSNSDEFEEYDKFTSEDSKHAMFSQNIVNTPIFKDVNEKSDGCNNFTSDNCGYMSFDQPDDDDDALSLFAESITGIESSRCNSSIASVSNVAATSEEYVPQSLSKDTCQLPKKFIYRPTKIQENTNEILVKKSVCEKQTADSTSINKESEYLDNTSESGFDHLVSDDHQADEPALDAGQEGPMTPVPKANSDKGLMATMFKPLTGVRSFVFRGLCFFNLVNSCKNPRCRFPHIRPDPVEIRNRLVRLREDYFIMEYMLMRNWPLLRRMFGLLYVQECSRRELTRILVEMAIDFILKANASLRDDALLQTEVLELTLLDLNNVDLNVCQDLLNYCVAPQTRLCDVFMRTIANTQNFSRFKPVFCKMTNFVIQNGRTFSSVVVEQILERVCILPYDKELLESVLNIIKNTDVTIFQNNNLVQFEKQLAMWNKEFSEEFLSVKNKLGAPLVRNKFSAPAQIGLDKDPLAGNSVPDSESRGKRYTSPDTTNIDISKQPPVEPIITRTINQVPLNQSYNCSSTPNSNVEEWTKPNSILNKRFKMPHSVSTPLLSIPMFRPPMRLQKRQGQRQVTYGAPPAKYPRRQLQHF